MNKTDKKEFFNLSDITPDRYNIDPFRTVEIDRRDGKFINWGQRNDAPNYYLDLYNNCPILNAIISGSIDYTVGKGFIINPALDINGLDECINSIVFDRWIFGGFAVQIMFSSLGIPIKVKHIPFDIVRLDKNREYAYIIDKDNPMYVWKKTPVIKIYDSKEFVQDDIRLYYFVSNKCIGLYPKPDYYSAISSIETQIAIDKFHFNEINNNFSSSKIITFNSEMNADPEMSDEKRVKIQSEWKEKFSGKDNAGRWAILMLNDGETINVNDIGSDNYDTRYIQLYEVSRTNIISCLSAPPCLFGLPQPTGFADQQYEEAFNLYDETKILPKRLEIQTVFNKITGIDNSVVINRFNFIGNGAKQ